MNKRILFSILALTSGLYAMEELDKRVLQAAVAEHGLDHLQEIIKYAQQSILAQSAKAEVSYSLPALEFREFFVQLSPEKQAVHEAFRKCTYSKRPTARTTYNSLGITVGGDNNCYFFTTTYTQADLDQLAAQQ